MRLDSGRISKVERLEISKFLCVIFGCNKSSVGHLEDSAVDVFSEMQITSHDAITVLDIFNCLHKTTFLEREQRISKRVFAFLVLTIIILRIVAIVIEDNYYLLAFDDYSQEMRTYRVDRMKDIRFTGEPRDGEDEFKQIDLKTYTKRVFSMYGGEQKLVEIRFINPLLDAVVDRFGTKDVQYAKVDETHFSVTAKVEISDQFFGWILGFGKKAKLLYPNDVIDQFKAYMDKIREMY